MAEAEDKAYKISHLFSPSQSAHSIKISKKLHLLSCWLRFFSADFGFFSFVLPVIKHAQRPQTSVELSSSIQSS